MSLDMTRGSFSPDTPSSENGNGKEKSRKPDNTAFKQQRLPAWQPILTAGSVLPAFFVISFIFIPIGVVLLLASNDVIEFQFDYTQCDNGTCAELRTNQDAMTNYCTCEFNVTLDRDMPGDVYLYYGLSNFFQNHRRYVKSRDDNQLVGNDVKGGVSGDCSPYDRNGSEPIAPCGAIANSLFNDTLTLKSEGSTVSFLNTGIAWTTDKNQKFNNPPPADNLAEAFQHYTQPFFWQKRVEELDPGNPDNNGYENEAFIVWMRTAAFPDFRKLYGRLNRTQHPQGLTKGTYTLEIDYNFPVTSFGGSKRVILSTTSWIGGKNSFLGIAYIVVGSLCLVVSIALCLVHHFTKKANTTK